MTLTRRYAIRDLTPYVNWIYFMHAWGMPPRFAAVADVHDCPGCRAAWVARFEEADRPQAREAEKLHRDALDMLRELDARGFTVQGLVGLFPAWSDGDDVLLLPDDADGRPSATPFRLPFLRQQRVAKAGEPCLCLADFISPHRPEAADPIGRLPVANVMGLFATAVEAQMEVLFADDDYRRLLVQTLCDRLAEAAAEKLHEDVRRRDWGYAPDESLTPSELFAEKYAGRRPAVGYPSMPDQSFIFLMDKVIHLNKIGITLTESGMMCPHAAVAGLMLGHPATRHFGVGPIDEVQLCDYAARRGEHPDAMRRFLAANLRR